MRICVLASCRCVYQHADDVGTIGVALDKNLVHVAGKSLQVRGWGARCIAQEQYLTCIV